MKTCISVSTRQISYFLLTSQFTWKNKNNGSWLFFLHHDFISFRSPKRGLEIRGKRIILERRIMALPITSSKEYFTWPRQILQSNSFQIPKTLSCICLKRETKWEWRNCIIVYTTIVIWICLVCYNVVTQTQHQI